MPRHRIETNAHGEALRSAASGVVAERNLQDVVELEVIRLVWRPL